MGVDLAGVSAFAVVFAATIAGIFLLLRGYLDRKSTELSSIISRENAKLSAKLEASKQVAANRQCWINDLRSDLALFQSLVSKAKISDSERMLGNEVITRIELRMNPNDPDYQELHDSMAHYVDNAEPEKIGAAHKRFTAVCQRILKREWEVLKKELSQIGRED